MEGDRPVSDNEYRARAAQDTANAAVLEDWTQSTVPPPLLGVEGVEPGEPHIPLVMVGHDLGNCEGRAVRNLTAAQARDLAALLDARADVIDPPSPRAASSSWEVRSDVDDRRVAGPFSTYAEADDYCGGFDDVYPAEVKR